MWRSAIRIRCAQSQRTRKERTRWVFVSRHSCTIGLEGKLYNGCDRVTPITDCIARLQTQLNGSLACFGMLLKPVRARPEPSLGTEEPPSKSPKAAPDGRSGWTCAGCGRNDMRLLEHGADATLVCECGVVSTDLRTVDGLTRDKNCTEKEDKTTRSRSGARGRPPRQVRHSARDGR